MKPEELKRTEAFRRTLAGYKRQEVDAYVDKLLDTYGQLYRDNLELILRVKAYKAREDEIARLEAEAEAALEAAHAEADRLTEEGRRRRDELIADGKARGEEALEEGRRRAEALLHQSRRAADREDERMRRMEQSVTVFHREMCRHYQEEIDALTSLRDRLNEFEPEGFVRDCPAPAGEETEAASAGTPAEEANPTARAFPDEVSPAAGDPADFAGRMTLTGSFGELSVGTAEVSDSSDFFRMPEEAAGSPGSRPVGTPELRDEFSRVYDTDDYVEQVRRRRGGRS